MDLTEFGSAIADKTGRDEVRYVRSFTPMAGTWHGESLRSAIAYSPLDEYPRCGDYDLQYYTLKKTGLFRDQKLLRTAICQNCLYVDEVNTDPQTP